MITHAKKSANVRPRDRERETVLAFEGVPRDPTTRKNGDPSGTPIYGSAVYRFEVARALLQHGTYDRYYFIDRGRWAEAGEDVAPASLADDGRARVITVARLPALRDLKRVVLMTGGSNLINLLPIRAHLRRPEWPVGGITHSLNAGILTSTLLSMLFEDLDEGDVLICSSRAGLNAVRQQLDALREYVGRRGACRATLPVVPLGIDVGSFQSLDRSAARASLGVRDDEVVLLYLGRFSQAGKCDLAPLVAAFRDVRARHPQARLVLAGDDTEQAMAPALLALAGALGVSSDVRVCPDPTDAQKRDLLASADVFVAMSDHLQETFGISVIEAMAAGLPVVAADWSGYRELVVHGETGLLVRTLLPKLATEQHMLSSSGSWLGDRLLALTTVVDLPALTCALSELVGGPDLRVEMSRRAAAIAAARYDWRVIIPAYEAIWHESLRRRARRRVARPGLFAYEYDTMFRHYPTRFLDDADRFVVAPTGGDAAWRWILDASPGFVPSLLERLVAEIAGRGPMDTRQLIDRLSPGVSADGTATEFLVRTHVARLMKCGVIDFARSLGHAPSPADSLAIGTAAACASAEPLE